jgi:6-phosphogluconate dehydrogenase (decarboxylating)
MKGEVASQYDRVTIAPQLKKGDIYIKGANALNYDDNMAGILIGGMDGATIGNVIGHIIGKQVNLIIPIGLEKRTYEDINELYLIASEEDYEGPRMWPIVGTIITEIEALGILTGVDAYLYAAGGIAGAEGAVRLLVEGTDEEVEETLELIESIKGEPRYLL